MLTKTQNNPKQPNGMPKLQKSKKTSQKARKAEHLIFLASQWDADLGLRVLGLRFKFLVVGFKVLDRGLGKGYMTCAKAVDKFLKLWTTPKTENAVCEKQTESAAFRLLTACGGAWQRVRMRFCMAYYSLVLSWF